MLQLFGLKDDMEKFLNYLDSDECYELLKRNKMTTYIETGNTLFDNINSGERVLDFIAPQQDYDKKLALGRIQLFCGLWQLCFQKLKGH